jgi:hypothetical protein
MIAIAVMAFGLAQTSPSPDFDAMLKGWKRSNAAETASKPLGPGPHTLLIISVRGPMTKLEYRTGTACQKALDSIDHQNAAPEKPAPSNGVPLRSTMRSFQVLRSSLRVRA